MEISQLISDLVCFRYSVKYLKLVRIFEDDGITLNIANGNKKIIATYEMGTNLKGNNLDIILERSKIRLSIILSSGLTII